MKATIYRYDKKTIKSSGWDFVLTERENGTYNLWKQHSRNHGEVISKEVEEEITQEKANIFKNENKNHLIEIYNVEL